MGTGGGGYATGAVIAGVCVGRGGGGGRGVEAGWKVVWPVVVREGRP